MFNILSILIGVFALILGLPSIFPGLGWTWWFILPVAVVGALVGQLSSGRTGRNFNLLLILLGVIRLSLFGGFV